MILLCGTWYGRVGVWVFVLWWDELCDGFNNTFSTGRSSRKVDFFDWICQKNRSVEKSVLIAEKLSFDCVRKKPRFSLQPKREVFD